LRQPEKQGGSDAAYARISSRDGWAGAPGQVGMTEPETVHKEKTGGPSGCDGSVISQALRKRRSDGFFLPGGPGQQHSSTLQGGTMGGEASTDVAMT